MFEHKFKTIQKCINKMELSIEEDKGGIDDLKAMRVKEVQNIRAQLDQFFEGEAQSRQDVEKNLTDVINEKVRKLNEMVMLESDIKNTEVNIYQVNMIII